MIHIKKLFKQNWALLIFSICALLAYTSCQNDLENVTYGTFTSSTFFKTPADAKAAVSAMYSGMMEKSSWAGWGAGNGSFRAQAFLESDEGICVWGGSWNIFTQLQFTPDDGVTPNHYLELMPIISEITVNISKIQEINMEDPQKQIYIGELKALRAYYSQILYLYYGPVPIRIDPAQVNNPTAPVLARPTKEEMVSQIVKDYSDAIAVLPNTFAGSDYGRFSKAASLASRMKLYMQEKRWAEAIADGKAIQSMNIFNLVSDYHSNFSYENKGGNSEIIFGIVCSATPNTIYTNMWLAHALATDYADPSGVPLTAWGGFLMPWKTYDKFEQSDKRLSALLKNYPIGKDASGKVIYKDARASNMLGAVPVKFGADPTKTNSQTSGVDMPIIRYADIELMLAEAINNLSGPTSEAITLINDVRSRAGLPNTTATDKVSFQTVIENERLFELWGEGSRRDDLIRWGKFIQRAINDGHTNVDNHLILYPLPRSVVNQSNGVITQNPGYN